MEQDNGMKNNGRGKMALQIGVRKNVTEIYGTGNNVTGNLGTGKKWHWKLMAPIINGT